MSLTNSDDVLDDVLLRGEVVRRIAVCRVQVHDVDRHLLEDWVRLEDVFSPEVSRMEDGFSGRETHDKQNGARTTEMKSITVRLEIQINVRS